MTQLETYRGRRNSTSGIEPVNFVRDVTTDFPNVQPWHVLGRVGIWGIRQSLADENSVLDPLELRSRAEVPDGRNSSRGVLDEIMLGQNQILGDDFGEDVDQLLDRDTVGSRAVPEFEQVIVDSRYEFAVGARKAGYVEKFGNGASSTVKSISLNGARTHKADTHTNTLLVEQV